MIEHYIQHEPTNMNVRGGVKSVTVYMTNEERYRLVNSIYSNPKRLTVAYFILSSKQCTSEQIIEATGFNKSTVSQIISEMVASGAASIAESSIDGRSFFISLTEVGKKLLRF